MTYKLKQNITKNFIHKTLIKINKLNKKIEIYKEEYENGCLLYTIYAGPNYACDIQFVFSENLIYKPNIFFYEKKRRNKNNILDKLFNHIDKELHLCWASDEEEHTFMDGNIHECNMFFTSKIHINMAIVKSLLSFINNYKK